MARKGPWQTKCHQRCYSNQNWNCSPAVATQLVAVFVLFQKPKGKRASNELSYFPIRALQYFLSQPRQLNQSEGMRKVYSCTNGWNSNFRKFYTESWQASWRNGTRLSNRPFFNVFVGSSLAGLFAASGEWLHISRQEVSRLKATMVREQTNDDRQWRMTTPSMSMKTSIHVQHFRLQEILQAVKWKYAKLPCGTGSGLPRWWLPRWMGKQLKWRTNCPKSFLEGN